jgi:DNA-binding NtrC family response regulator
LALVRKLENETETSDTSVARELLLRPVLFISFQAAAPLAGASRHSLADIDVICVGRGESRFRRDTVGGKRRLLLQLPDAQLSREHAELRRQGLDHFELVDRNSKNHSFVDGVARTNHMLADGERIQLGSTFFTLRHLREPDAAEPDVLLTGDESNVGLATLLPDLALRFAAFARAAPSRVSLIVVGETGTGKELAARAAHELSRRSGAFTAVNCGALPSTLMEAELFGHRKGSFSGALEDRIGLIRASDKGTLFLDEVAELPLTAQAALLRVIQEGEVLPIGHVRPVSVDLRIVSATHRNLKQMVERGEFRADLHARLQGLTLSLPPLRERLDEIGLLLGSILRRLAGQRASAIRFSTTAARRLLQDRWRHNVRSLEKCLSAALVLREGDTIDLPHLESSGVLDEGDNDDGCLDDGEEALPDTPLSPEEEQQRQRLVGLMTEHHGNISAVARETGKARFQIRRWIKRYRIR